MPRHTRREIPFEPHPTGGGSSQLPRCRVSREFAEELGLDPFTPEPPPREESPLGAARDSEAAPRSYAQPTVRPAAVERPPRRAERVGKVALLVAALCIVAGASYTMGRATGRTEGELAVTHHGIMTLADAVASAHTAPVEPERSPEGSAWPLAAAANTLVAPQAAPMAIAAPTVVEPSIREPEADVKPAVAIEAPADARIDETRREERRSERAEARALRREAARQAAAADEAGARAMATTETASPVASETPIAAATETPTPAPTETTPEVATSVDAPIEPSAATTEVVTTEVVTTEVATSAEPPRQSEAAPARPARPIPLDPLAGAIGTDSADRIGRMLSPMHADVRELEALPERPSRTEIRSGLHRVRRQARDCGHEGTLMVDMVIRPDGHVVGARVVEGTSDAAVVECVRSALMDARFAPFSGPEFVLHYPIRL